jgi:hypothetical protein
MGGPDARIVGDHLLGGFERPILRPTQRRRPMITFVCGCGETVTASDFVMEGGSLVHRNHPPPHDRFGNPVEVWVPHSAGYASDADASAEADDAGRDDEPDSE